MKQYLDLLKDVLENGQVKKDRTGTGTISVFGRQLRFDLREGFPLVTTKKVHLRSIIHELLWFLKGDTNIQYLNDNNVTIWDEWAVKEDVTETITYTDPERAEQALTSGAWKGNYSSLIEALTKADKTPGGDGHALLDSLGVPRTYERVITKKGELGAIYSKQWTDWVTPDGRHINQISKVIDQLRNDPDSRRIIVSAWNVGDIEKAALPPCHNYFQFYTRELTSEERSELYFKMIDENVELHNEYTRSVYPVVGIESAGQLVKLIDKYIPKRELSCFFLMRSNDTTLGLPFNIASYALLTHMVAQQVNMTVGELVYSGVDVHIYSNHLEQVKLQLTREPLPLPKLNIKRKPESIFDYQFDDFEIVGYQSHPAIKAPVAI